ncbi:MAG: rhizobiocin, partial [Proteobacteria bacterium]|nr:rhizobiocin [Pseudomonadota bacterium]
VFDDGTIWTPPMLRQMVIDRSETSGNDTVNGYGSADVIQGGHGDDLLKGGGGDDTYVYNRGDGNDVIDDGGNGGYADKLVLHGILPSDVTLVGSGENLTLVFAESAPGAGDGGSVLAKYTLSNGYGSGMDSIVFDDGTTWNVSYLKSHVSASVSTVASGSMQNDNLVAGSGDSVVVGYAGDDILNGGAGNDILLGGEGRDQIYGAAGNDHLDGGNGDDRLNGGAGADSLTGGSGSDVFHFDLSFGHDTVADFSNGDVIEFAGAIFADFSDMLNAATEVDGNTVIAINADNSVILQHVALASLSADEFRFVA